MQEVMEHYGAGVVSLFAVSAILVIILEVIGTNSEMIAFIGSFLQGICG